DREDRDSPSSGSLVYQLPTPFPALCRRAMDIGFVQPSRGGCVSRLVGGGQVTLQRPARGEPMVCGTAQQATELKLLRGDGRLHQRMGASDFPTCQYLRQRQCPVSQFVTDLLAGLGGVRTTGLSQTSSRFGESPTAIQQDRRTRIGQ